MEEPIRITIKGTESDGVDAPTVEDLLGQVEDFVRMLVGAEHAIAGEAKSELVWRITKATTNSPISFEITPFPASPAVNVSHRVARVEKAVSAGLRGMGRGEVRPAYFTDDVLPSAKRIHARIDNGLADTVVHFPKPIDPDPITIDRGAARQVRLATPAAASDDEPYRELGSVEGYIFSIERDGRGASVFRIRTRLERRVVKVTLRPDAVRNIERFSVGQVLEGLRVRVYGVLKYEALGKLGEVAATDIEVFDPFGLPGMDDILDPNLTDGQKTEDFLAGRRDG